jgi:DNA-binding IclR family transcriptional regulator
MRRRLLDVLHHGDQCRTSELVTTTGIPKTPVDRTLEDLAMLGLVDRSKTADHDTAAWISRLSDDAATAWPASPEVSE